MECELCKSQRIYVRCFDCCDFFSSSKFSIILCQQCDSIIHPTQQSNNDHQMNPQQSQLVSDTPSNNKSPSSSSKTQASKNNVSSSQTTSAQKQDNMESMMANLNLQAIPSHAINTQHLNHDSSSSAAQSHTSSSHSSGYGSRGGYQQAQSWRSQRPTQGLSQRNPSTNPQIILPSRLPHLRSLICSECEERDSHGYCEDCEQFMCQDCSKTIHNKGARRRHVLDSQKMMQLGFCDEAQANNKIEENKTNFSTQSSNVTQQRLTQIYSQENFRSKGGILTSLEDQKSSADFSNTNPSPASSNYSGSKILYSKQQQSNDNLISSNRKVVQNLQIHSRIIPNTKNESASYSSSSNLPIINQSFLPMYQPVVIEQDPTMTKLLLIFRDLAQKGNLLLLYENLIPIIAEGLQVSPQEAKEILLSAEYKGYLITTVRQFGRAKTLTLVSMRLGFISLESLLWVLKSLQIDEMAPNERAVQSRVKEAYGIKIHQFLWEVILEHIFKEQESLGTVVSDDRQMSLDLKAIAQNFSNSYNIHSISSHSNSNSHSSGSQDQGSPLPYEFKYARQYDNKLIEYKLDSIVGFETEDNTQASQKTFNLFIQGQIYEGYDQVPMKDSQMEVELYTVYKQFLEDYFMGRVEFPPENQNDEVLSKLQRISLQRTHQKLANSSSSSKKHGTQLQEGELDFNEDGRAITGGRYGCAQFVKVCGPELMRLQSLGRLAQMVQRSINEDYLRYQKTLLVLTELINKDKEDVNGGNILSHEAALRRAEKGAKLQTVKQAIIEVLAEQKGKVQLPQLPNLLRKKLPFKLDYNQLGFAKLKDLISTMSNEIKLELIGPNHTLAYLILSGRYHHENGHSDDIQNIPRDKNLYDQTQKNLSVDLAPQQRDLMQNLFADGNLQLILNGFYQMLMENPFGVESNLIVAKISKYLGMPFEYKDYGCHSLYEFIKKFVMPTIDLQITNNKPDVFVIRSTKILAEHQNQNFNRSASHSSQSLGHSNSQSSISSQSFAMNQNISPSNHAVKQPSQSQANTIISASASQQQLSAPTLSTGRKIGNSRNGNNQIHFQSFQGITTPQNNQKTGLEHNSQMFFTNYGFSNAQGQGFLNPQAQYQMAMASTPGNMKQNNQVNRGTFNERSAQMQPASQIRGSVGNQEMVSDLKRVPSSQLYIPGPSSFYGRANTSQTNTHLNVSHFKDAFDGENSSLNQPTPSQVNFPNNKYHQYHMSYDQFTLQKRQLGATNPQLQHPHLQNQPSQQINRVGTMASGISGGSIQPIPEMQLNHRINHSYGGGPILQRNFLQHSHLFERPFSVDTQNEQRSRSNSPHHNKTISYFNMGSASSSFDFSTSQLQHLPLFQTQLHSSNFNPQIQSLQVHQEESRESSLGTSDINSNKDKIQAASTDLQFDANDDAEGLGFHSERIEDLLEDYNEDTTTNLKSVEELSVKTTLVHSHQLSKGSMSHLLPSGSFISGQNQNPYPAAPNGFQREAIHHQHQQSGFSPYSRGGDDYEDQMLLLHQSQQQHMQAQHQAALAHQQYYPNVNLQLYHYNNLLAGGGSPAHPHAQSLQQQHYKALSEDFAAHNFKNQVVNAHAGYFFQDPHMNQIPLRLNQQQRIQQFIPNGLNQNHQQQR